MATASFHVSMRESMGEEVGGGGVTVELAVGGEADGLLLKGAAPTCCCG